MVHLQPCVCNAAVTHNLLWRQGHSVLGQAPCRAYKACRQYVHDIGDPTFVQLRCDLRHPLVLIVFDQHALTRATCYPKSVDTRLYVVPAPMNKHLDQQQRNNANTSENTQAGLSRSDWSFPGQLGQMN